MSTRHDYGGPSAGPRDPVRYPDQPRERPTAVGIFAYAGGFTYGVKQHFDVEAVLELPCKHVYTARENLPEIDHWVASSPDRYADDWPLDRLRSCGCDLVYGNPPCAPWSNNNKSGRHYTDDPRFQVDHTALRETAVALMPKVFTFESVIQMQTKGRDYLNRLIELWVSLGYHVTEVKLNAKYLGTAQNRKSFFFVAHRVRLDWDLLELTDPLTALQALTLLGKPDDEPDTSVIEGTYYEDKLGEVLPGEKWRDMFDRQILEPHLGGLTEKDGDAYRRRVMQLIRTGVIPGQILDENRLRYQVSGRASWGCVRLHPDREVPKIVGYDWIHPIEDRLMTIQEYAWLNGFPRGWRFVNGKRFARTEIAQGVMPPVAAALAKVFAAGCREGEPIRPGHSSWDFSRGVAQRLKSDPVTPSLLHGAEVPTYTIGDTRVKLFVNFPETEPGEEPPPGTEEGAEAPAAAV